MITAGRARLGPVAVFLFGAGARMRGRRVLAIIVLVALAVPLAARGTATDERLLPLGPPERGNRNAGCQFLSRQEAVAALGRSGPMGQYNFGEGIVCNIGLGANMIMIDVFDPGPNSAAGAGIDARKRRINRFQIEQRIPGLGREAWKTERRTDFVWREVTVSVRQRHFRVRQDTRSTTPPSKVATLAQLVSLARSIEGRLDA
jgi:hypothetical protein